MKIFRLGDLKRDYNFAQPSIVGSWTPGGELCKVCQYTSQTHAEPLLVEWEEGSDVIGEFSWQGSTMIVRDSVKAFLERNNFECRFGVVQVVPPSEKVKKRAVRVPFLYEGPTLYWLIPTEQIPLDEGPSGVNLQSECPQCGNKEYSLRREGIVISRKALGGRKMFRITQFGKSKATFVTQSAADLLIKANFTNFHYKEAGRVER